MFWYGFAVVIHGPPLLQFIKHFLWFFGLFVHRKGMREKQQFPSWIQCNTGCVTDTPIAILWVKCSFKYSIFKTATLCVPKAKQYTPKTTTNHKSSSAKKRNHYNLNMVPTFFLRYCILIVDWPLIICSNAQVWRRHSSQRHSSQCPYVEFPIMSLFCVFHLWSIHFIQSNLVGTHRTKSDAKKGIVHTC